MKKGEDKLVTMGYEKIMLSRLSNMFDLMLWHDYLDEEYKTDKQMEKSRKNFIDKLEEGKEICDWLIAPTEAKEIIKKFHGELGGLRLRLKKAGKED